MAIWRVNMATWKPMALRVFVTPYLICVSRSMQCLSVTNAHSCKTFVFVI